MPQDRADFRTGVVCALLANIHRSGEDAKVFAPGDFIPQQVVDDEDEQEELKAPTMVDLTETSKAIERMLGKK